MSRFWNAEDLANSEKTCVTRKFEQDITFNRERYVTKLPFKPDHDSLSDGFKICEIRLKNLKGRLLKENLFDDYDIIFKDYLEKKIIQKVPEDEIAKESGSVHYLPHRLVVRQDKETTKIRAVFDSSCAYSGPSLNKCFYSGPNLLSKIFGIIIRFRLNPIGILAGVKQAFLNVEMSNDHKDFLCFLWYDTNDLKIVIYRFLRIVFG